MSNIRWKVSKTGFFSKKMEELQLRGKLRKMWGIHIFRGTAAGSFQYAKQDSVGWNCLEPEVTSLTMQGFTLPPCRFSCPAAVVAIAWNNCANTQWLQWRGGSPPPPPPPRTKLDSQCKISCENICEKNAFLSADTWV